MRILFVCTGNTCRSPFAEGYAKHLIRKRKVENLEVLSRGISAIPGTKASERAVKIAGEFGVDLSGHVALPLVPSDIANSDLVLVMTFSQKIAISQMYPQMSYKVRMLVPFAEGVEDSPYFDIEDPYGRGDDAYRDVFTRIKNAVKGAIERLEREGKIVVGKPKIYIASDHGGFALKEVLKDALGKMGYHVEDLGTDSEEPADYPDFAKKVAERILSDGNALGILICGTGVGMSIAANKIPGVRAALCTNEYMAKMSREHNDANVLVLGGRVTGPELAISIVKTWLRSAFSGDERHVRRLNKVKELEVGEVAASGQHQGD